VRAGVRAGGLGRPRAHQPSQPRCRDHGTGKRSTDGRSLALTQPTGVIVAFAGQGASTRGRSLAVKQLRWPCCAAWRRAFLWPRQATTRSWPRYAV